MNKLTALFNLFRKGQAVANPGAWKDTQNYAFALGALILAALNLAQAFGYALPLALSVEDANAVGLGLATAIAFVVNNISSDKTGILPARRDAVPVAVPESGAQAGVQPVGQDPVIPRRMVEDDVRRRAQEWIASQDHRS